VCVCVCVCVCVKIVLCWQACLRCPFTAVLLNAGGLQKPKSLLGRLSRSNKRGSSGYGAVDLYEL